MIARLVNANLGFRVLTAGFGDFDSHAGQPSQHSQRMTELNAAVARFFELLSPSFATRVTVMTFSEFGRTSWDNDGNGTDHGTSAPHFVFGENVKGGRYGQRPSMAGLRRWDRMAHHVDFRSYYGSLIDGWLGGGSSDVLGGNFENLGLFSRGPGVANPVGSPDGGASKSPGTFVPMNPKRLADTRDGAGGVPRRRMAPKEFIKVHAADRSGIPADAIAIVANVTAASVSEPTFFTVCPGGARKPETSNLNPRPGAATPNLVVMGLGADGCIDVHNDVGTSDCIVDVFGYFRAGSTADRYRSLSPRRLLDTRDGTGAPAGKRGRGHRLEFQVTDRHGVPTTDVSAVVLNVTVVNPGSEGYLTVGPAGASKPETSNVNFRRHQTVPNLVICKVGVGGKVNIWIEGDAVDVLADVFGYFGGAGSLLRTVVPSRVLDTRAGLGAARSLVPAGGRTDVQVATKAGVPSNATAVVLNVTATDVAAGSFVTVWPTDVSMPDTSNLNIEPGDSVANLVISKLSADGKVSLANARGTTNLIADVLGYFID